MAGPKKDAHKLSLAEKMCDHGFNKAMENCAITSDTIGNIKIFYAHILGGIIFATTHLIKSPHIKDMCGIAVFESILVSDSSHYSHQVYNRNY